MPRAKKDTEALHCNLDANVSRDLTEFCIEHYRTTGKL